MTDQDRRASALRRPLAFGAAAGSGLLYFLAFPGVGLWPLGFVALVPLIVALRGQSPKAGALLGGVAGVVMTSLGFYWLVPMLEEYSGFPWFLCVLFAVLLSTYQGGRSALLGWLVTRAERKGWSFDLAFVLAFAASEVVFPLLFPWAFGAVVHDLPVLLQGAELAGPTAVSVLLVVANLALAEPLLARIGKRRVAWKYVAGLAGTFALAVGAGALRLDALDARMAAAPKAVIGVVQGNTPLFGDAAAMEAGRERHLQLTRALLENHDPELVVWSETSVLSTLNEQTAHADVPARISRGLGVPLLFGASVAREEHDGTFALFNSALLTDRRGELIDRYDKRYRLPFGEYLPFGDTFPVLYDWSPHSGRFSAGTRLKPLKLGEHELAVFICYEDVLPGFVNSIVRAGAPDLLVNLTNDGWFGDTTEPWIHLALAKFRAVEHRRFFVRSTNSGVSAIIDAGGRVVVEPAPFQPAAAAAPIAWLRGTTPFQWWGEAPWWLTAAAVLALGFVSRRPRGQGRVAERGGFPGASNIPPSSSVQRNERGTA